MLLLPDYDPLRLHEEDAIVDREAAAERARYRGIGRVKNRPRFRTGLLARLVRVDRLSHEETSP